MPTIRCGHCCMKCRVSSRYVRRTGRSRWRKVSRMGDFPVFFVDVNAVSPATARQLGRIVGKNYVDGAIVGPPARSAGSTRLYLSGVGAHKVGEWFSAGFVETVVLGEGLAEASALKMCYAAYTKGSGALVLAIRALAEHEGRHRRPACRMGAVPARPVGTLTTRCREHRTQGLAVRRRDGGDCRHVPGRRSAGRVPCRGGGDLCSDGASERCRQSGTGRSVAGSALIAAMSCGSDRKQGACKSRSTGISSTFRRFSGGFAVVLPRSRLHWSGALEFRSFSARP